MNSSSSLKKRKMSTSLNESFGTPPEEIMEFAASDNISNAELKRIMDEPFELEEIPLSPEQPNFNMFEILTTPTEEQMSTISSRFKQVSKEDVEKAQLVTVADKTKKQTQWAVNLLKCKQMTI